MQGKTSKVFIRLCIQNDHEIYLRGIEHQHFDYFYQSLIGERERDWRAKIYQPFQTVSLQMYRLDFSQNIKYRKKKQLRNMDMLRKRKIKWLSRKRTFNSLEMCGKFAIKLRSHDTCGNIRFTNHNLYFSNRHYCFTSSPSLRHNMYLLTLNREFQCHTFFFIKLFQNV